MMAASAHVECLDAGGRVLWRERVEVGQQPRSLTIGRSAEADLVLDDEYVAPLHAVLSIAPDGRVSISDLGSRNGIIIAGRRLKGAHDLAVPRQTIGIGRTHLRVHVAGHPLAPERLDRSLTVSLRHPIWLAVIGGIVVVAQAVFGAWLEAPRDLASDIVLALGLLALLGIGWVAFWALLSRIMAGEWRWVRHTAIFLCVTALSGVAGPAIELGLFSLMLPAWRHEGIWMGAVAVCIGLFLHLRHASNLSTRSAAATAILAPALLAGGGAWWLERSQAHDVDHIELQSKIYPPGLRLRSAGTPGQFLLDAKDLRLAADARRSLVKSSEEADD